MFSGRHDLDHPGRRTIIGCNFVRGGPIFWGVGKAYLRRRVSAAVLVMVPGVESGRIMKPSLVGVSDVQKGVR